MTGLSKLTTYHYRAYAINSLGTSYGADTTFITLATLPTITTQLGFQVSQVAGYSGGNITDTGGGTDDIRGIVWDLASQSLPGNVAPGSSGYANKVEEVAGGYGVGQFAESLTSLVLGTTYYIRAYAHNSIGYVYGNEIAFTIIPYTTYNLILIL